MQHLILSILIALGAHTTLISDVPFVKQEGNLCGPAALSSVMAFYGLTIDQQEIADAVYSGSLHGTLITDMTRYARHRGFRAEVGRGTEDEIKACIDGSMPVIALVDTGTFWWSDPHYLVVIGYDEKGFIAHSGLEASKFYEYNYFKEIWERIGSTYLLLYR